MDDVQESHTNAASRVLAVLERVKRNAGENEPMVKALPKLFENEAPTGVDPARHASQLQHLLLDQLDEVERWLDDKKFPHGGYKRPFKKIRSAFSPAQIGHNWGHVVQLVTEDVLVSLHWSAYAMDDEGEQLAPEEVAQLVDAIRALLSDPALEKLPTPLRRLIDTNLKAVLDALINYKITGQAAFNKATEELVTVLVVHGDVVDAAGATTQAEAKPLWRKAMGVIGNVIDKASKTAERFEKLEKLMQKAPQLLEYYNKAREYFDQLPSP